MGTRGFVGVVVDDEIKIGYNHFDSYPSGIGVDVLKDVKELVTDLDGYRAAARALKPVPEGEHDENYSRLRALQGKLLDTLRAGEIVDAGDFPVDSLFCEWGYLVDLDHDTFDVYKGWQKSPPKDGRWAGRPTQQELDEQADWARKLYEDGKINDRQLAFYLEPPEYFAVELVATWDLNDLPDEDKFLTTLQED